MSSSERVTGRLEKVGRFSYMVYVGEEDSALSYQVLVGTGRRRAEHVAKRLAKRVRRDIENKKKKVELEL